MDPYYLHSRCFQGPIISETILNPASNRLTTLPIQYPGLWDLYKKQLQCNWVVQEVDLSEDLEHWENILTESERQYLLHNLAFFSAFDGIVNCQIKQNVIDQIQIKEAECAYGKQFEMENVHGEMYGLLLITYVRDLEEQNRLINSIEHIPTIRAIAQWCQEWIDGDWTFAHRIIAFAIVEGVIFSSAFASIFWVQTLEGDILPGLFKSNRFIRRDENLHTLTAVEIYRLLENKLNPEEVQRIFSSAMAVLEPFVHASLPERLRGMNSESMIQYVQYAADRLSVQLGYDKMYRVSNPLDYMAKIDLWCKNNFFEKENDEYATGTGGVIKFQLVESF